MENISSKEIQGVVQSVVNKLSLYFLKLIFVRLMKIYDIVNIQSHPRRFSLATLTYLLIVFTISQTSAQQINPNNLPLCPKPDYSKTNDIDRTATWHNCWGIFKVEMNKKYMGDVIEAEWRNGLPNGVGSIHRLAENTEKGDQYFGELKDGLKNGKGVYVKKNGNKFIGSWENDDLIGEVEIFYQEDGGMKGTQYKGNFKNGFANGFGMFIFPNKEKYIGEIKDSKPHGDGIWIFKSGLRNEGVWKDGKFLRIKKLNFKQKDTFDNDGQKILRYTNGDKYIGELSNGLPNGRGTYTYSYGDKYEGDFRNGFPDGFGAYTFPSGEKYVGEFKQGKMHGYGTREFLDGKHQEGIWDKGHFISEANIDRSDMERESQQLTEERRRPEQAKSEREQKVHSQRINLQVTYSQPSDDGIIIMNIQTNTDTASLLVNGEEQGGHKSGDYSIKRIARAGQETQFIITATDIKGYKETKTITVVRQLVESKVKYPQLNPVRVKKQPERDSIAIIIGIANYKSLPVAEYANDDARAFYDYAIRGLGVKSENIKLLVDAEEADILKAFRSWLPSRTKSSTDIYVYYSGHGLPTPDGNGLYMLPLRADREVIDDTAIPFSKINDLIVFTKPKSVTMILDSCYSGQTKTGQSLVTNARPVSIKTQNSFFPPHFTVISASQADQISSSSAEFKHGLFSYYFMKGMEGDADINKDGKITLGEMRDYLVDNVGKQAAMMSRKQEPQLIGDADKPLVGG
jgi:hypothetical protein